VLEVPVKRPLSRIVVMMKVPAPGRVKTRLAPLLGDVGAAALARAMAEDVVATALSTGLPVRIAVDGDFGDPWLQGLGVPCEPQASGDLGARLRHALRDGGVAIGTDAPTLPRMDMLQASVLLGQTPALLQPAFDGGYVLVAARREALGIFDDIPWSSPDTLAVTVERARGLGIEPTLLSFWYDVDEPHDLVFLRNHLRTLPPTVAPRTRAFLQDPRHAAPHR
jgi:hypothetical protein